MKASKLILVLAAAVFVLFGCGDDDKEPQYGMTEPVVERTA